jgi:transposase
MKVCFGFSKDHRPDLKQFKIGLAVNENGLPVMGEILSGNTSDVLFNPQAAVHMKEFFDKKQFRDVVFVSDCAIVSTESLSELAKKHVRFISRLPETFSLAEHLKDKAFQCGNFTKINDEYQVFAASEKLDGRDYRFLVVQSSHLAEKKEKTLQKQIDKKKSQYEQEGKKLTKEAFACEADALMMLNAFSQKVQTAGFSVSAQVQREELKSHGQKGRPKATDEVKVTILYRIQELVVGPMSSERLEDLKRKESTFVLLTNVMNKQTYDDKRILEEYKHQNCVENRFKFLKNPVYFGPMYLKNQRRLQALGYVFILALLIASYLEYRVRENLKKNADTVLLPGKKKTNVPSITTILEILGSIQVVVIAGERFFPDNIDPQALKMIEWAGFQPSVYLQPLPWDTF